MQALPGEFGSSPIPRARGSPHVPNPKPLGAAKIQKYKQLGAAGGAKVSNFFQHPFTHLGVGAFAGLVLADMLPDRHVMGRLKHPASTLLLTNLGHWVSYLWYIGDFMKKKTFLIGVGVLGGILYMDARYKHEHHAKPRTHSITPSRNDTRWQHDIVHNHTSNPILLLLNPTPFPERGTDVGKSYRLPHDLGRIMRSRISKTIARNHVAALRGSSYYAYDQTRYNQVKATAGLMDRLTGLTLENGRRVVCLVAHLTSTVISTNRENDCRPKRRPTTPFNTLTLSSTYAPC